MNMGHFIAESKVHTLPKFANGYLQNHGWNQVSPRAVTFTWGHSHLTMITRLNM